MNPSDAKVSGIYHSLESNEIRLLSVAPRSEDGELHCTLQTVNINGNPCPVYIALSYTWGDQEDTLKVSVNGRKMQVTRNLKVALELFREIKNPVPVLWVDAICIDQSNRQERGIQVQKMQTIFSQAKETWIWLGSERDESGSAFELVEKLSRVYLDTCPPNDTRPEVANKAVWGTLESRGIGDELVALDKLFARDYWYRVWCVQEVAMSRKISIFCGKHTISWASLLLTAYFLDPQRVEIKNIFRTLDLANTTSKGIHRGLQRVFSIQSIRNDQQGTWGPKNSHKDSLLVLLLNHRLTESSEKKDKYIALAGLVSQDTNSTPLINSNAYAKSVSTKSVYIFATYALAIQSLTSQQRIKALDFLECAGQAEMSLPSWVPDWSSLKARPVPLLYWQFGASQHKDIVLMNAPGPPTTRTKATFSLRGHIGSLLAKGFVVDTIQAVSPPAKNSNSNSEKTNFESFKYPTSGNQHPTDILWRTLVLDRAHTNGTYPPTNWGDLFYNHILHPSTETSNFKKWFEQNQEFKICGSTLSSLVRERQNGTHSHEQRDGEEEEEPLPIYSEIPIPETQGPIPQIITTPPKTSEHTKLEIQEQLNNLRTALTNAIGYRRLATTSKRYLSLVPYPCQVGDLVVILADCSVPVLLRKRGEMYVFIGTAYVHGIMQGEGVQGISEGERLSGEFDIR